MYACPRGPKTINNQVFPYVGGGKEKMSWFPKKIIMKSKKNLPKKLLGTLLIASLLTAPGFAISKEEEEVTRMEFVKLMVKNQSQSTVIPANAQSLSDEDLYDQVSQNLKEKGFNVLASKNPDKPLSQQEFVRITYAFSDQPSGKSIFEQKQYLKEAEIISTADVGLTTGIQGRAVQYRGEEDAYSQSEMAAPVFMQDRVETDLNSMVTFTFDDGSTMSLGEDAVVNITEHIYDPERDFRKTIVNVALGAVRFKVTKGKAPGSMFQVITPVATAGVRGTEFVTIVEPGGKTRIVGLEGKVETFPRLPNGKEGKHEFVVAGTMHEISKDGSSIGLQQADAALMDKVFQKTNPNKKMKRGPKMTMAKIMKAATADLKSGNAFGKTLNKSNNGKGNNKAKINNGNGKAKGLQKKLANGLKGKGKGLQKKLAKVNKGKNKDVGKLAKNAAKGAAKSAAKTAAKDAAKNAAQTAAKESAKQVAKNSAKASAAQMAKNAVKEATQQAITTAAISNGYNGQGHGHGNSHGNGNGNGNGNGHGNGNGIGNGIGNGVGNGIGNGVGNGIGIN